MNLVTSTGFQKSAKLRIFEDVRHNTFHTSYMGSTVSRTYSVYVHDETHLVIAIGFSICWRTLAFNFSVARNVKFLPILSDGPILLISYYIIAVLREQGRSFTAEKSTESETFMNDRNGNKNSSKYLPTLICSYLLFPRYSIVAEFAGPPYGW